jgi:hypothetical protein
MAALTPFSRLSIRVARDPSDMVPSDPSLRASQRLRRLSVDTLRLTV